MERWEGFKRRVERRDGEDSRKIALVLHKHSVESIRPQVNGTQVS